ncbi:MAG: DUF1732 domain-containing protein, partial [Rhodospirillales bacterium]|nr:DUF1732 domain-containing protein [Rhodospirillales bacterium]
ADEIVAVRDRAMLTSLEETLAALAAARAGEGRSLAGTLIAHLDEIERLCGDAGRHAAAQPAAIKARIEAQLTELLGGQPALPPERLAQEAAMMAARADVREELDRLVAHIGAARALLAGGGA